MKPNLRTNGASPLGGPVFGRRMFLGGTLACATALTACDDDKKVILAGRRVDVLSTGAGLTVDPDDKTPITLPAPQTVAEWPMAGRVRDHVAVNAQWEGAHLRWDRSIGAGVSEPSFLSYAALGSNGRGAIQGTPIIADGRAFTRDAQGLVRAWTWPAMGSLWSFVPKPKKSRSTDIGGGLAVQGDVLYIVDGVAETLAVDVSTGHVRWRVDIGTPGRSAPTVSDGKVFFTTIEGRLFALDAATGNQLWTYSSSDADTVLFGQPAPAVVDGVVVAGFGSGDLVALRGTSGEMVWSDSLGGSNGRGAMLDLSCIRGAPVIQGGTVYAVSMSSVLVAIDLRSGRRLWEREVGGQNMPVICDDWMFIISADQQLACLDRLSGHVRWITQLRRFVREVKQKDAIVWTGPVLAGGKLVCLSTFPAEGMRIVDAITGEIEGMVKTRSPCVIPPIVCDGNVLVLSNDGHLSAYG